MIHISDLGEYAHRFFADQDGHVPEHGDHWGNMKIDHGENDPDEEGISGEERQRRITYLNEQWWPEVIAEVNREKEELSKLPGGNPIKKWKEAISEGSPKGHGFGVDFS
jgi:hypothetical protein